MVLHTCMRLRSSTSVLIFRASFSGATFPPLLRQHLAGVVPARLPVDHEVHDTIRPCKTQQQTL